MPQMLPMTCVSEADPVQEMYEAPRQRANLAMMSALDGLQRIYKPQEGLLASIRSLGLGVVNSSSTMKQQIMKYAGSAVLGNV